MVLFLDFKKSNTKGKQLYRGFRTRMVYLGYTTCFLPLLYLSPPRSAASLLMSLFLSLPSPSLHSLPVSHSTAPLSLSHSFSLCLGLSLSLSPTSLSPASALPPTLPPLSAAHLHQQDKGFTNITTPWFLQFLAMYISPQKCPQSCVIASCHQSLISHPPVKSHLFPSQGETYKNTKLLEFTPPPPPLSPLPPPILPNLSPWVSHSSLQPSCLSVVILPINLTIRLSDSMINACLSHS